MTPVTHELITSFISCNKQVMNSNGIIQIARMLQICSQPVCAISIILFADQPARSINLFRREQDPDNSYVIIGANEHIYLLEKQKTISEDIDRLCFVCKLCDKTFYSSPEWLIHVNELNCVVTNPCRWFPDLYDIPSLNRSFYTHIIANYYRSVRMHVDPQTAASTESNIAEPQDDPPPSYEEINGN